MQVVPSPFGDNRLPPQACAYVCHAALNPWGGHALFLWLDWQDPQDFPPFDSSQTHILPRPATCAVTNSWLRVHLPSSMIYVQNWISWLFVCPHRRTDTCSWPKELEEEDASKLAHFPLHLAHVLVSSQRSVAIWTEFIDIGNGIWAPLRAAAVCILHYIFRIERKLSYQYLATVERAVNRRIERSSERV